MTPDEIRVGLETAVGVPEEAMRAAMQEPAAVAPAIIAVAQGMAAGRLPLPREERLLRFGLHALAAARETSVWPAFQALLRRPALEVEWLLGGNSATSVARLLLSLFDGDDDAVCAAIADTGINDAARSGMMQALARLVWEGRASRGRVLALLDRFDREALAPAGSSAWFGWQAAIRLLGATDLIERVRRGWEAGRLSKSFDDADRQNWIEQTCKAAGQPDDPERFAHNWLMPINDPTAGVGWSAEPPSGPREALSGDELTWLDMALLRTVAVNNQCLELADGLLTALAAGPVRVPASEYLAELLPTEGEFAGFDSPEHRALVVDLLTRHHESIERDLAAGKAPQPWIYDFDYDLPGMMWARGYLNGIALRESDWQPLTRNEQLGELLVAPLFMLLPDRERGGKSMLTRERRSLLVGALPDVALATKAHWQGAWHPLLAASEPRAPKIGRNDPCSCGSGRKYKRCCGAVT